MNSPKAENRGIYIAGAALAVVLALALGVYLGFCTPEQRAVRARLNEADARCEAAIGARLAPVDALFHKGHEGAQPFAEDAVSLAGKWHALVGLLDGRSHKEYLSATFADRVFGPDQLRDAVEGAVRGYLLDVEGIEAEMLVHLRADLAGLGDVRLPHADDDAAFAAEYRRLLAQVSADLRADLGVDAARLVSAEVVAALATQATAAAAAEMGISLTVFGSSTVATLGVGAIATLVADYIIGLVLEALGYNPADQIAASVRGSLRTMRDALLREDELFSTAKVGTLRGRLHQLHEARAKVRRETIHRYLSGGTR